MSDQAEALRQLVKASGRPSPSPLARSLVFTSGKGGVGTSNLVLNLALALGERGQRVALVDGDLGLANLDLLCGLASRCDLGDVLAGGRPLSDAIVTGPHGVRILIGAHGSRTAADVLADSPERLVHELAAFEADSDFLLIDAGSGLNPAIATLASAADGVVVVTTPEPTSIADAHAALRRVGFLTSPRIAVNQAQTEAEAAECLSRLTASSRQFLGLAVSPLGFVRSDPHVPRAERARRPVLAMSPKCLATRDVRRIAATLMDERRARPRRRGLFATIAARWADRRAAG